MTLASCDTALPQPIRNHGDHRAQPAASRNHVRNASGNATFRFRYSAILTCTLSGVLEQHGQLYRIPTATYQCSDGVSTSATLSEIKATTQGIEGRMSAGLAAGACQEDAAFSAVLQ